MTVIVFQKSGGCVAVDAINRQVLADEADLVAGKRYRTIDVDGITGVVGDVDLVPVTQDVYSVLCT